MNDIKLNDEELRILEKFKKTKKRAAKEIDKFIKMIIALREMPDKNPQLKKKK